MQCRLLFCNPPVFPFYHQDCALCELLLSLFVTASPRLGDNKSVHWGQCGVRWCDIAWGRRDPVSQLFINLVFQTGIWVVSKGFTGWIALCSHVSVVFLVCSLFNLFAYHHPLPFCPPIYGGLLIPAFPKIGSCFLVPYSREFKKL